MMATCLLRTLGLDDAQLARATAAWDRLAAAEAAAAMKRAEARRTAEAARKAEEEARKGTQPQKAAEKTMQDVTGAR
jgi:hypothetical protein